MERTGLGGPSSSPDRSTPMLWSGRSTRATGSSDGHPSDTGSREPWSTARTIAARSATALTTIGVEPPKIAVFDFGVDTGRIVEQMPGT